MTKKQKKLWGERNQREREAGKKELKREVNSREDGEEIEGGGEIITFSINFIPFKNSLNWVQKMLKFSFCKSTRCLNKPTTIV